MGTKSFLANLEKDLLKPNSSSVPDQNMFARMFPTKQSPTTSLGKTQQNQGDLTNHEDIDFYWDNPQARTGKKQDILDIISKNVSARNPPSEEWKQNPEEESVPKATKQPLFPKTNPRKDAGETSSALQDSNELQSLFSSPELRNQTMTFAEIIDKNREQNKKIDPEYWKANQVLGMDSTTNNQRKHVIVGDMYTTKNPQS